MSIAVGQTSETRSVRGVALYMALVARFHHAIPDLSGPEMLRHLLTKQGISHASTARELSICPSDVSAIRAPVRRPPGRQPENKKSRLSTRIRLLPDSDAQWTGATVVLPYRANQSSNRVGAMMAPSPGLSPRSSSTAPK